MRSKIDALVRRMDALDPPREGCPNCVPLRYVEVDVVYDAEGNATRGPDPAPPVCQNPGHCPRVLQLVIEHHRVGGDALCPS